MASRDSVIIFHRCPQNQEEDFINREAFLEAHGKILGDVKIIDYVSGDLLQAKEIVTHIKQLKKIAVIINSPLSSKEYNSRFDLYSFFQDFKSMNLLSLYLMDSEGRLYRETNSLGQLTKK